jgi:hypothetical protein
MTDVEFEPVIVSMGSAIVAMRSRDGTIAWHVPTEKPVSRFYRVGTRLFAVTGTRVICLELRTGNVLGQVDVGFVPDAGIVSEGHLVLTRGGDESAPPEAIVCMTSDGRRRWRGTLTVEGGTARMSTFASDGKKKSEITFPFHAAPVGMAHRDAVVQPDHR